MYYMPWLSISGIGSDLSFAAVQPGTQLGKVALTGAYHDIDATNLSLGGTASSTFNIRVHNFDSIALGASSDWLVISGDSSFIVEAGGGDDRVVIDSVTKVTGSLDGGDGNDTLVGGAGADRLDGGSGFDIAVYSDSATGLTLDLLTSL